MFFGATNNCGGKASNSNTHACEVNTQPPNTELVTPPLFFITHCILFPLVSFCPLVLLRTGLQTREQVITLARSNRYSLLLPHHIIACSLYFCVPQRVYNTKAHGLVLDWLPFSRWPRRQRRMVCCFAFHKHISANIYVCSFVFFCQTGVYFWRGWVMTKAMVMIRLYSMCLTRRRSHLGSLQVSGQILELMK